MGCSIIQRNRSVCIICGLTFNVHHCVNYISFDCFKIISFFLCFVNIPFLYYMQYIKVMSICNIPNDIFFSKKCSYYETTILSVMIHYCTYWITKTLHLDLLVQTWVTRPQTVVCFHHASLSMTCMITVRCECSSGGRVILFQLLQMNTLSLRMWFILKPLQVIYFLL